MRLRIRGPLRLAVALSLGVLAGCLPTGRGEEQVAPITPGTVEVTSLPAPGAAPVAEAAAPVPAPEAPPAETPAPPAAEPVAPPPPASPEARACLRGGGLWVNAGSGLMACQRQTGEGMKSCRRGSDCVGECLARSGTCAPVAPLFGCNEVLDDFGRRTTQCVN